MDPAALRQACDWTQQDHTRVLRTDQTKAISMCTAADAQMTQVVLHYMRAFGLLIQSMLILAAFSDPRWDVILCLHDTFAAVIIGVHD